MAQPAAPPVDAAPVPSRPALQAAIDSATPTAPAVLATTLPDQVRDQFIPAPAHPVAADVPTSFDPGHTKPRRAWWVLLWLVTAAIPSIAVWFAKPTPVRTDCNCKSGVEIRPAATPPAIQKPATEATPAPAPPAPEKAPAEPSLTTVAMGSSNASAAQASAVERPTLPANSPSSTVLTVVETDSNDRVSILVKSRPTGAKVLRRGKEIGKTPLFIEIGKGEHRIFEVGLPASGYRRLSLDGEKTEVLVNIGVPPKADK